MEIKIDNEWVSVEKGDWISDGFEDGSVVSIREDGGDIWFGVYDGKEGWDMHLREVKKVNGDWVRKKEEGDV
jgi:hypothetical protein